MIDKAVVEDGDHIYAWRGHLGIYAHHGIYVGDGQVIHFGQGSNNRANSNMFMGILNSNSEPPRGVCPKCKCDPCLEGVTVCCLDCFLDGGALCRYVYGVGSVHLKQRLPGTCTRLAADSADKVVRRAKYLLRHGFGRYDLWKHNCEDFALYCTSGCINLEEGASGQTALRLIVLSWFQIDVSRSRNLVRIQVQDLVLMLQTYSSTSAVR